MSGYDTPNEAIRLVSLGARFAVEQQYQEQIAALAGERDRALAEAASLRERLEEQERTLGERVEQLERQIEVLEEALPVADADAEDPPVQHGFVVREGEPEIQPKYPEDRLASDGPPSVARKDLPE